VTLSAHKIRAVRKGVGALVSDRGGCSDLEPLLRAAAVRRLGQRAGNRETFAGDSGLRRPRRGPLWPPQEQERYSPWKGLRKPS